MFDRPTIVAVRFFRLDSEDPIGDAYNYLQYLASQDEEDVDEEDEQLDGDIYSDEDGQQEEDEEDDEQRPEPVWPLSFLFNTGEDDEQVEDHHHPERIWHVIKKDAVDGTLKTFTTQFITAAICSPVWQQPQRRDDGSSQSEIEVNLIGKQPIPE